MYTVRMHGLKLGTSKLEHAHEAEGIVTGSFEPGPDYKVVQPIFRLFAEASPGGVVVDPIKIERYHAARDALKLQLVDEIGQLLPTKTIHIADYSVEKGDDALELEVAVASKKFWRIYRRPE